MDANEILLLRDAMGGSHQGMTPYEEASLSHMQSKRANGTTVTAVVAGFAAVVLGATAWGFAQAKATGNRNLIAANASHAQQIETLLAGQIAQNRSTFEAAKAAQDSINITTTQTGSQSTSVSQTALAQAEATLLSGALLGDYAKAPQKVQWVSEQVCKCPGDNCSQY